MAHDEFGVQLDVGMMPVADLVQGGHTVMVARYRLSDTIEQAVFMGGGLYVAEETVKADPDGPYGVPTSVEGTADFSGMECRWDHVPSHRDEIVALLVHATGASLQDNARIYDDVIATLRDIYGDGDSRPGPEGAGAGERGLIGLRRCEARPTYHLSHRPRTTDCRLRTVGSDGPPSAVGRRAGPRSGTAATPIVSARPSDRGTARRGLPRPGRTCC